MQDANLSLLLRRNLCGRAVRQVFYRACIDWAHPYGHHVDRAIDLVFTDGQILSFSDEQDGTLAVAPGPVWDHEEAAVARSWAISTGEDSGYYEDVSEDLLWASRLDRPIAEVHLHDPIDGPGEVLELRFDGAAPIWLMNAAFGPVGSDVALGQPYTAVVGDATVMAAHVWRALPRALSERLC